MLAEVKSEVENAIDTAGKDHKRRYYRVGVHCLLIPEVEVAVVEVISVDFLVKQIANSAEQVSNSLEEKNDLDDLVPLSSVQY